MVAWKRRMSGLRRERERVGGGTTGVRGWSLVVRVPPPPPPSGGNQENGIEGMITFVSYLTLERAG